MTTPLFHLAIPVDDLEAGRAFYGELLGCPQGREDPGHWIDFDLRGHQLVLHKDDTGGEGARVRTRNAVDGLRLIAADLRGGGGALSRTVEQVAAELERGTPLPEAFEKYKGQFPSLYGRLVGAGVRAGNLPGVLFNLGRHLELVQRLREALWRSLAYPLAILVGLAGEVRSIPLETRRIEELDRMGLEHRIAPLGGKQLRLGEALAAAGVD